MPQIRLDYSETVMIPSAEQQETGREETELIIFQRRVFVCFRLRAPPR